MNKHYGEINLRDYFAAMAMQLKGLRSLHTAWQTQC